MAVTRPESESKTKARILFDLATEEYFGLSEGEHSPFHLERIYRWFKKALDEDPSLASEQLVANMLGNFCSVAGWICADEEMEERSREYYEEAIKFLGCLDNLCWHEHWYMGKALATVGRPREGLSEMTLAVDTALPGNPRGHDPSPSELAALWADIADVHNVLGNPEGEIESLWKAHSYVPEDEVICGALVLKCFFASQFTRAVQLSQETLNRACTSRGLFLECLAHAALLDGNSKLACQTYRQLLDMVKNSEARAWYSRMLGYSEGLLHSGQGDHIWNHDKWEWELHGGGEDEEEPKSLQEIGQSLREEIRDTVGRANLQMLRLAHNPEQERNRVAQRLCRDVFGEYWGTIRKATQDALIDAELHWLQAGKDDYSSETVQYAKALELEIAQRLLIPFQRLLFTRGVAQLTIDDKKRETKQLENLTLHEVRKLLVACEFCIGGRKNISRDNFPLHLSSMEVSHYRDFTTGFEQAQRDFLFGRLCQELSGIGETARIAKHKGVISKEQFSQLRSSLLGSQVKPGLLVELVRLLPLRRTKQ